MGLLGAVTADDLATAEPKLNGIDLDECLDIPESVIATISHHLARRFGVIPIARSKDALLVAIAQNADVGAAEELSLRLNRVINFVPASPDWIRRQIRKHYSRPVV